MQNSTASTWQEIYVAGGCFWGVEEYFNRLPGVIYTQVGYANGFTEDPTYEQVCHSNTGFAETVYLRYNPEKLSLAKLLHHFLQIIDPTALNRQGNDLGTQYRTGIYYVRAADAPIIEAMLRAEQEKYAELIVTEVEPLKNYYPAEDYHQHYLKKNPNGYCHISFSSLPANEIEFVRPGDAEIKAKLSTMAHAVTQTAATEPPFSGQYNNFWQPGIYVDIVTGEPLFASSHKFDAGCGWPSFTEAIDDAIETKPDYSMGMLRTEVKSAIGQSHLGHVFADGPKQAGGLRYCINSVALRFIAYEDMVKEGYGQWLPLVKTNLKEDKETNDV